MHVLVEDGFDADLARAAEQLVERHRADELEHRVDDVDLVKGLRRVLHFAEIIDRAADRPERRHRDEIRLHQTARRVLGEIEAARQGRPFRQRQTFENGLAVFVLEVFENVDRVVGIEFAQAVDDGVDRQRFEQREPDRLVDFGQRREVEGRTEQFDEAGTKLRVQRLQEFAEIGFVEVADQRPEAFGIAYADRLADRLDQGSRDRAFRLGRRRIGLRVCRGQEIRLGHDGSGKRGLNFMPL